MLTRTFLAVSIMAALASPVEARKGCISTQPFHVDARQNPAIVTFDNGCVIYVTNGIGGGPPQFTTQGQCSDWSWINRFCLKR